ncbi:MAG: hypothetical protein ACHQEB_00285 [Chitinophagales bacterium]
MIRFSGRHSLVITGFLFVTAFSQAQNTFEQSNDRTAIEKPAPKPFKILTSGKQITLRSNAGIKNVMVWTASGHRIIEQQDINSTSYTFNITIEERVFFVMIQLQDGKHYTEKIGVK